MKNKNIWIILIIIITIIILTNLLIFRTGYTIKQEDSKKVIKIGSIASLTGETGWYGQRVKEGIDLAVEDINSQGGINNKKLEIIYEDSQCDQKQGVSAAQKLINFNHMNIIIGPTCSSVALSVAPITEENKVILITPIASTPKLSYAGDYVFRTKVSGALHGIKMAEFSYNKLNARTASILYINKDNGVGYKDSFNKKFKELGGEIISIDSYEKGEKDFRIQLTKIKHFNPDVFYLAGQASEKAIKQASELDLNIQIVSAVIGNNELLEIAGDAAEGLYYTESSFDIDDSFRTTQEYQEKYKNKYGKISEIHAANAYDAVILISQAIEKCNENTSCIRDYLYSIKDYKGVSGIISFDENGDVDKLLIIKTVKNQEFVVLD